MASYHWIRVSLRLYNGALLYREIATLIALLKVALLLLMLGVMYLFKGKASAALNRPSNPLTLTALFCFVSHTAEQILWAVLRHQNNEHILPVLPVGVHDWPSYTEQTEVITVVNPCLEHIPLQQTMCMNQLLMTLVKALVLLDFTANQINQIITVVRQEPNLLVSTLTIKSEPISTQTPADKLHKDGWIEKLQSQDFKQLTLSLLLYDCCE